MEISKSCTVESVLNEVSEKMNKCVNFTIFYI